MCSIDSTSNTNTLVFIAMRRYYLKRFGGLSNICLFTIIFMVNMRTLIEISGWYEDFRNNSVTITIQLCIYLRAYSEAQRPIIKQEGVQRERERERVNTYTKRNKTRLYGYHLEIIIIIRLYLSRALNIQSSTFHIWNLIPFYTSHKCNRRPPVHCTLGANEICN
jgi:hypothetical protein